MSEPEVLADLSGVGTFTASLASLRRVFREGFTVEDIASPLPSFDAECEAAEAAAAMRALGAEVAGVRSGGVVDAWVRREELTSGRVGDHRRTLEPEQVVSVRTPLSEAIPRVAERGFVLVEAFGAVAGVVAVGDLAKPAVRMWLFGLITLAESSMAHEIRRLFPGDSWREVLSAGRVGAAEALLAERSRLGEHVDLVDCLQLGDKAWIVSKHPGLLEALGIPSRRLWRERLKQLERLRNRLAHSQQMQLADLPTAVRAALQVERILGRQR